MDRDIRHTFGGSSPKIDRDTDERYLIVSVGTHTPDPLLHHLWAQSILLLSFGTLGMSSGVREAHPRYLDDTQHTRGETPQQWHWVSALVDRHRLGDEMIICKGGISFITEHMRWEQVRRETCVTLFSGHVETMHEQRIPGITKLTSQYVSRL